MSLKPMLIVAAAALSTALAALPVTPAIAGGGSYGGMSGGPKCYTPVNIKKINIYKPVWINKNINIYKPISIYKPVTINKNININKNIKIENNINVTKNINNSKYINIQKNITINKGGAGEAEAAAFAFAGASSNASAVAVSGGGGNEFVTVENHGSTGGAVSVHAEQQCVQQEASVVKAIHAICVDSSGQQYPASHMIADTWINASYEGEIARCIPGSTVKVIVGDVSQSDQGMAGTYEHGEVLSCGPHEAVAHFRGGMLKCVPEKPVKDCTERTNLRRWGSGDMFFSYRAQVCVNEAKTASTSGEDLSGMQLDGGVGADSN